MLLFSIPLALGLLLLAASLLFAKVPSKGRDWPSLLAMALVFAAIFCLSWVWQYGKFQDKFGLFYYMSPRYGDVILTTTYAIFFMAVISYLLKDKGDRK
jgi:DNA-binding transcriptional regulator of glucitol operon